MFEFIALTIVLCVALVPLWVLLAAVSLTRRARADGVAVTLPQTLRLLLLYDYSSHQRRRPRSTPWRPKAGRFLEIARRASLAGVGVTLRDIETQFLAGGDPALCVDALIAARARGTPVDWWAIAVIDLAGRDPLAAVEAGADLRRVVGGPEYDGMFRKAEPCAG